MKVVIWGATQLGKHLISHVSGNDNSPAKPIAVVDNDPRLQGTRLDAIPIISYRDLSEREDVAEITILITVKSAKNIFQILNQLNGIPVKNIGIVKPRVIASKTIINLQEKNEEIIWALFEGKRTRIVPRIETNLIDTCNLKCKGCTHFSSLYNEDSFYSLCDYRNDLLHLRKIGKLLRLRLLGGEPFLLDNLDEYINIARNTFPETDIEIVTNGLLIPKVNEKIMLTIKEKNASVMISLYKPTLKMITQITEKLDKYKIWWQFTGDEIKQFSRSLTLEKVHNPEQAQMACTGASCIFLRKGKLYKCPVEGLVNDFYQYYKLDKKQEGGIEINREPDILYEEIVDLTLKPSEMCKYCTETPEMIPWSVAANPTLQDWLYQEWGDFVQK